MTTTHDARPPADGESRAATAGTPAATDRATNRARRLPELLVPHRNLMRYYILQSLLIGPFFPFMLVPLYFRFRSLRYALDAEGISMRWGVLFRREVSLTYARIQDIHLTSNVVERWLGLARIQVQTASGSAAAEMTIEGVPDVEGMRDFLYERMRGAREEGHGSGDAAAHSAVAAPPATLVETRADPALAGDALPLAHAEMHELTDALHAVAAELRALRMERARHSDRGGEGRSDA